MKKFFVISILLALFAAAIPASAQYTDVLGVRVGIKDRGWISGFAGIGRGGHHGGYAEGAIHITNGVLYEGQQTFMECDTVGPDLRSRLSYRAERKSRKATIKAARGKSKKAGKLAAESRALAQGARSYQVRTGESCETFAAFRQHRGELTVAVRLFSTDGEFLGWGRAQRHLSSYEYGSEAFYVTELIRPAELTEQDDRSDEYERTQSRSYRPRLTERYFKPGYVPPRRRN